MGKRNKKSLANQMVCCMAIPGAMFIIGQDVSTIIVKIVRSHSKTEKLQSRQDTGRVECVSHREPFISVITKQESIGLAGKHIEREGSLAGRNFEPEAKTLWLHLLRI